MHGVKYARECGGWWKQRGRSCAVTGDAKLAGFQLSAWQAESWGTRHDPASPCFGTCDDSNMHVVQIQPGQSTDQMQQQSSYQLEGIEGRQTTLLPNTATPPKHMERMVRPSFHALNAAAHHIAVIALL